MDTLKSAASPYFIRVFSGFMPSSSGAIWGGCKCGTVKDPRHVLGRLGVAGKWAERPGALLTPSPTKKIDIYAAQNGDHA